MTMATEQGETALLKMSSDEINCLVYSYLRDSGYDHSAYNLRNEAYLDHSPNVTVALPRGELITLLQKALLFYEAEEAFQNKGKAREGPVTLLGRYRNPKDGPIEPMTIPSPRPEILPVAPESRSTSSLLGRSTSNKPSEASSSGPMNGVVSTAPVTSGSEATKNGDEERAKKRARTDDTDDEIVEVLNPNIKKYRPPRYPSGSVMPMDGQPPGTMKLRGHNAEVFASQWNPTMPTILASGGKGGQVIIWKLYELTPRGQPPKSEIRTPNHSIVAVLPPPPSRTNAQVDLKDLTSMSWSKDGQYLAVGHQDASIQIWSWKGELIKSHDKTHTAPVFDLDWSADGSKLISAGLDGLSILWQTESIKEMRSLWANTGHEKTTCCLDAEWITPRYYATCGTDKKILIYSTDDSKPKHIFEGHRDEVNQIRLSPSGTLLASVSDDMTTMLWDVSPWVDPKRPVQEQKGFWRKLQGGHDRPVSMVQWMPTKYQDGHNLLATFSREAKTACLWDIRTGDVVQRYDQYSPGVPITRDLFTHGFDPTGRFYALGGVRFLVIYSLRTGKPIWTWPFADSYVADIAWQKSNDGRRLAIAKENGFTEIIDIWALGIPELAESPANAQLTYTKDIANTAGLLKTTPASAAK